MTPQDRLRHSITPANKLRELLRDSEVCFAGSHAPRGCDRNRPCGCAAGHNRINWVSLITSRLVEEMPPNVTLVAPVKLFPVIATDVPTGPLTGVKLAISGTTSNFPNEAQTDSAYKLGKPRVRTQRVELEVSFETNQRPIVFLVNDVGPMKSLLFVHSFLKEIRGPGQNARTREAILSRYAAVGTRSRYDVLIATTIGRSAWFENGR